MSSWRSFDSVPGSRPAPWSRPARRALAIGGAAFVAVAGLPGLSAGAVPGATGAPSAPAVPAVTPTLTTSVSSGGPGLTLRVSGANWHANDTVFLSLKGVNFCNVATNASGAIPRQTCTVPSVPSGPSTLQGAADSNTVTASTPFAVTPRVTYLSASQVSPGAAMTLNAGGFAAGTPVTATVGGIAATVSSPNTDSNGSLNGVTVTVPASVGAGPATLVLSDGTSSATKGLRVYTPSFTLTPTSGTPNDQVSVTGGGFAPNTGGYFVVDTSGVTFCGFNADAVGGISLGCTLPVSTAGGHTFTAVQNSTLVSATKSFVSNPGFTYVQGPDFTAVTPFRVDVAGMSPGATLTATFDGAPTPMTINGGAATTDSNGSASYLSLKVPVSYVSGSTTIKTAGTHNLVLSDGTHTLTTSLTELVPVVSAATSGTVGQLLLVSLSKLRPNDYTTVSVGQTAAYPYYDTICAGYTNATGALTLACSVPGLPGGAQKLAVQQDAGATFVVKAFTIKPGLTYQASNDTSPNTPVTIYGGGFGANKAISVTFNGTTVTPAGLTSDGYGNVYASGAQAIITPAATTAGLKLIVIKDASGSALTASVLAYAPTLSVSETSGPSGSVLTYSGTGFAPGDNGAHDVYLTFDSPAYNNYATCPVSPDHTGAFTTTACSVPALPNGSTPVFAQQDSLNVVTPAAAFSISGGVTYLGAPDVSPNGTNVAAYAGGLAPNVPFTVTVGTGSPVITNGSGSTDGYGNAYVYNMTMPSSLTAGTTTLTFSDGTNTANAPLRVWQPTAALSDSSVHAGDNVAVNGTGFPPSSGVYFYVNGSYFCGISADAAGDLSAPCAIPALSAGTYPVTWEVNNFALVGSAGSITVS